jgi:hypothetical protein
VVVHREGVFEQHDELDGLYPVGDTFQGPDQILGFFEGKRGLVQQHGSATGEQSEIIGYLNSDGLLPGIIDAANFVWFRA